MQGRTAAGWLAWADASVVGAGAASSGETDLVAAVAALYGAVGAPLAPEARARVAADAAALDPALAAPFAALVADVARAYATQAALAAPVVARAHALAPAERDALFGIGHRVAAGEGELPAHARLVTAEESLAMQANAAAVLAAVAAFRAAAPALAPVARDAPPLFRDPAGLVALGGPENTLYPRDGEYGDAVLVADVAGDDTYLVSAGGACPDPLDTFSTCNGLALSVNVDLAGNDLYDFDGLRAVAHGAASTGALGVLVDDAGNDAYRARYFADKGDVTFLYYIQGVVQGAGQAGVGVLLDGAGDDVYDFDLRSNGQNVYALGQGYGGVGGVGLLVDALGNDAYATDVHATNGAFGGVYTLGTGLYAAVGIVYDLAGDDAYWGQATLPQADYYAQGFGGFASLGLQVDVLGNDRYDAIETSTAESFGQTLNCAYGTAYYGAVGVFLDLAGDDVYVTQTFSWQGTATPVSMSEGFALASAALFVDASGDDAHRIEASGRTPMTMGRGTGSYPAGLGAVYLDLGGADTYTGASPSADGAHWTFGADVNLVPSLPPL